MPLPDNGRDLPESRFVVADVLVRFDHARDVAEVLAGPADVSLELLEARRRDATGAASVAGRDDAASRRSRLRARRQGVQGPHPDAATRSRSSSRSAPSGRPPSPRSPSTALCARVNPSPYLFLLELDGVALVGSSPETLVKCEGRRASLNPIAGSTSPGEGDAERLLASEKDRAEHVMLVDLGRNDLSRVCVPGR